MVTSRTATRREGRLGEGGVAQEQILDLERGLTQRLLLEEGGEGVYLKNSYEII